jgi:hypothetical protein
MDIEFTVMLQIASNKWCGPPVACNVPRVWECTNLREIKKKLSWRESLWSWCSVQTTQDKVTESAHAPVSRPLFSSAGLSEFLDYKKIDNRNFAHSNRYILEIMWKPYYHAVGSHSINQRNSISVETKIKGSLIKLCNMLSAFCKNRKTHKTRIWQKQEHRSVLHTTNALRCRISPHLP